MLQGTETSFNSSLDQIIQDKIEKGLIVSNSEIKHRRKRGVYAWPPSTLFIATFSLEMPLFTPDGVGMYGEKEVKVYFIAKSIK